MDCYGSSYYNILVRCHIHILDMFKIFDELTANLYLLHY